MPVKNDKKMKQVQSNLQGILKTAPRAIGVIAQNFFTMNFKRQGFLNNGLSKWPSRKDRRDAARAILVGKGSGRLMRSIRVIRADQEVVVVGTDVPYARIHNEGGTIHKPERKGVLSFKISKSGKSRFARKGNANFEQDATFKAHNINMPKRQFIGNSKELTDEINDWFKNNTKGSFK